MPHTCVGGVTSGLINACHEADCDAHAPISITADFMNKELFRMNAMSLQLIQDLKAFEQN